MNARDPKFTARLEEALRVLAKQPTRPLAYLASRFGLESGALQLWLGEFNGGQKLLKAERIDEVKRELGALSVTKAPHSAPNAPAAAPDVPHPPPAAAPTADVGRWLEQQRAKITARVNCFQVEVTPPLAAAWLRLNTGNRKPSKSKVKRFAHAMRAGRWAINGETVKFSATGRLIDGQSRLMAIELAGVPVVLELRAGLPDAAQQSMDAGEMRKGAHTLEMLGEKYPNILAAALKKIWLLEHGQLSGVKFGQSAVMENFEVPAMLERHSDLRKSVGWSISDGHKIDRVMPHSEAAFFHYVFSRTNAELCTFFFDALIDGVGLTKTSAIYHLREKLLGGEIERDGRSAARVRRALTIKAWNHVVRNEKVPALKFDRDREPFPTIEKLQLPVAKPQPTANDRA